MNNIVIELLSRDTTSKKRFSVDNIIEKTCVLPDGYIITNLLPTFYFVWDKWRTYQFILVKTKTNSWNSEYFKLVFTWEYSNKPPIPLWYKVKEMREELKKALLEYGFKESRKEEIKIVDVEEFTTDSTDFDKLETLSEKMTKVIRFSSIWKWDSLEEVVSAWRDSSFVFTGNYSRSWWRGASRPIVVNIEFSQNYYKIRLVYHLTIDKSLIECKFYSSLFGEIKSKMKEYWFKEEEK